MGAPLTIEQMILNHNIGVNISDAKTFKGHQLSEFSMVGHVHSASDITSGVISQFRLPSATSTAKGIVQLSSNINSNDDTIAASSDAVYAVKIIADGKANTVHTHNPQDINSGAFSGRMTAFNELANNAGIIRNIVISDQPPGAPVNGQDGQIYFQYEP